MSEDLHRMDDLFRKALDGHDDEPSAGVWDKLDRSLDKRKVVSINRKYKRVKWVAAALLLFACGLAMYTFQTRKINRELVKASLGNRPAATMQRKDDSKKEVTKPSNGKAVDLLPSSKNADAGNEQKNSAATKEQLVKKPSISTNKTNPIDSDSSFMVRKPNQVASSRANRVTSRLPLSEKSLIPKARTFKNNIALQGGTTLVIRQNKNTNKNTSIKNEQGKLVSANEKPLLENELHANKIWASIAIEPAKHESAVNDLAIVYNSVLKVESVGKAHVKTPLKNNVQKNNPVRLPGRPMFSLTAFFSPDIISNNLQEGKRMFREDDRNEIKQKESPGFSFSTGLVVNYRIKPKWSISAGLVSSTITKNIRQKNVYARPDNNGNVRFRINCSSGYSYITVKSASTPNAGDSLSATNSKSILNYFSIPLSLQYHFNAGRFSISPGAGISSNFLTKSSIETNIQNGTNSDNQVLNNIEGLKKTYLQGLTTLAADYRLNKSISLNCTPTLRFALTSINQNSPVKSYQSSLGLSTGLSLHF